MAKRGTTKRELIDTGGNKMLAKWDAQGQFKEMDDVGRSLTAARRRTAETLSKPGHENQGDRPRTAPKAPKKAKKK